MLSSYALQASLPASDISRARDFYKDKLDLKPVRESPDGGAYYESGGTTFYLYPSGFAGTNQATAAAWEVEDIEATVSELQGRGVVFEEYDFDELKTVNGIAETSEGQKAAWFKDSEGNILGIFKDA